MSDGVGMETNELRLSPEALNTRLVRRLRAELATRFIADVISFAEYVAARNPKGSRDQAHARFVNAELTSDVSYRDIEPIQPCDTLALRWR